MCSEDPEASSLLVKVTVGYLDVACRRHCISLYLDDSDIQCIEARMESEI
jgi:hypothetical protein